MNTINLFLQQSPQSKPTASPAIANVQEEAEKLPASTPSVTVKIHYRISLYFCCRNIPVCYGMANSSQINSKYFYQYCLGYKHTTREKSNAQKSLILKREIFCIIFLYVCLMSCRVMMPSLFLHSHQPALLLLPSIR